MEAVSYTHLDVYKRQEKDGDVYRLTVTDKKQLDELDDTLLLPLLMNYQMSSVDEQTVSYTHLGY